MLQPIIEGETSHFCGEIEEEEEEGGGQGPAGKHRDAERGLRNHHGPSSPAHSGEHPQLWKLHLALRMSSLQRLLNVSVHQKSTFILN